MTNFSRYKNLLPTLVLAVFSAYTAFTLLTSEVKTGNVTTSFAILPQHYGAFAAVALCLFSFFFLRKIYRYVLGATLVLGIFSVLNFTVNAHWVGLKLGALNITIQPLSFAVALFTLLLNWQKIKKYLVSIVRKSEQPDTLSYNEDVEVFKVKYLNLSSEELQKIIADKRFRPEAIEAAKKLLEERKQIQHLPSEN
jgi:hypothetical protein